MISAISSILRASTRNTDTKLNIISFPTHERYQGGLANTNANFYLWRCQGVKDWNNTYHPLPENHFLLNPNLGDNQLPIEVDFDLILSQNKFGQFGVAHHLARKLHLPLISLEHTLPVPSWSAAQLKQCRTMQGDVNIFISEYSRKEWGWKEDEAQVIHHGVDTDLFKPSNGVTRKINVLSVVNDFANRSWCCGYDLWREVTGGLPVKLLGSSPGLSKPAQTLDELISAYLECGVFLNTSLISPVPTVLLEAMACGCPIVSTNTCMIPEIIKDGQNGLLASPDKPRQLREKVELLLEDQDLAKALGEAARQTIVDRFPLHRFVEDWNKVFNTAKDIFHK
jgi:glycosyltransferase involved in cell wall biosynthesis